MTLAPFAAAEARANSAVFARLANAEVSIDGGAPFGAIFEADYALASVGAVGFASSGPALTAPADKVPSDPVGLGVLVGGTAYTVAEARPDGAGAVLLVLEVAP